MECWEEKPLRKSDRESKMGVGEKCYHEKGGEEGKK